MSNSDIIFLIRVTQSLLRGQPAPSESTLCLEVGMELKGIGRSHTPETPVQRPGRELDCSVGLRQLQKLGHFSIR